VIRNPSSLKESVVLDRGSGRKIANPVREGAVAAHICADQR
jgi:hypothetical protein